MRGRALKAECDALFADVSFPRRLAKFQKSMMSQSSHYGSLCDANYDDTSLSGYAAVLNVLYETVACGSYYLRSSKSQNINGYDLLEFKGLHVHL